MTIKYQLILISLYNKAGRRIAHWARMVADYGVALPGRQGWGYIEWPGAHHSGVERVRPWQRGEGVRSDELCGGVERTHELMHGGGSVRCAYELMWWWARAYVCSIANEGSSFLTNFYSLYSHHSG